MKPWYKSRNDERGLSTFINRYRSDHYNLNYSLGRKGIIKTERSICGSEREDLNHVIFRCRLYDEERLTMFAKMNKEKIRIDYDMDKLFKGKDWIAVKIIHNFLKKIKKML